MVWEEIDFAVWKKSSCNDPVTIGVKVKNNLWCAFRQIRDWSFSGYSHKRLVFRKFHLENVKVESYTPLTVCVALQDGQIKSVLIFDFLISYFKYSKKTFWKIVSRSLISKQCIYFENLWLLNHHLCVGVVGNHIYPKQVL